MNSRQHALEKALGEVVGGHAPPDRTFPILAAVRRARSEPLGEARARPIYRLVGAVLGVAAVLVLWLAFGTRGQSTPLQVQVREGSLVWHRADAGESLAASGESLVVVPRGGDRLVADPFRQTRVDLDRFGSLSLTPGTQVEIEDMKWQEFGVGFGSGSLTVAVLVGSFTWLSGGATTPAASGDVVDLELREGSGLQGDPFQEQAAQLERELADARAEIERLQAAGQRRVLAEPVLETEPVSEPDEELEPLELDPEIDAVLATVDWRAVSADSLELSGALGRLMTLLAAGEDVPHDLLGELERLKGTLHSYGAILDDLEILEGTNFDTRVRHPILGAQWMTALLQHSELPLDVMQRRALTDLARRYAAEDGQRRAAYGDDTTLIQKYVDELEMQDRFYRDADYLLSDAQGELFSAGEFEGRVGAKLLGTGSMAWGEWTQAVVVRTRDEFASAMTTGFGNALGLDGPQRDALSEVVGEWSRAFPAAWWDQPFDDLDRYGGYQVERLKVAAQLQFQFYDQVIRSVGLTPDQLDVLRKVRSLVVPYQRK